MKFTKIGTGENGTSKKGKKYIRLSIFKTVFEKVPVTEYKKIYLFEQKNGKFALMAAIDDRQMAMVEGVK